MRNTSNQALIFLALIAGWAGIVIGAPPSVLSMALSALFVMLVPGFILLRLLAGDAVRGWWAQVAYSAGLSSLYLMLLGLLMSVLLPLVGVARPLATGPLVIAIVTSLVALLAAVMVCGRDLSLPRAQWPSGWYEWLLAGVGAVLPLMAVAGALMLNNGGSNRLTLGMFGLAGAYWLALVWSRRRQIQKLYPYATFMTSTALLFATSMRGWLTTGHDIMEEYQVFQLTSQHGVWSMHLLQNAYTACLSITILPTILQRVTTLADPYVFKLLFQLLFALMPVVIYLMVEKFLPRRVAVLAVLVFITFPTFLTDMPMLNRQEVAFMFLALGLYTLFNQQLPRVMRQLLFLILGAGMILSHYSTSYVAVSIMLVAKCLELGVRGWDRWRHTTSERRQFRPLTWAATLILVFGVWLWDSPITHTSQGIASTLGGIVTNLPKLLSGSAETGAAAYSLVGSSISDTQLFHEYAATVTGSRDLPASRYYPAQLTNRYPLVQTSAQLAPLTRLGQWLERVHIAPDSLYTLIRSSYARLLQLLIVLGLGVVICKRGLERIPRQYIILGVAGLIVIGLQVLLPPDVINYGLLRLLQQCLMLLAPAVILASYWVLGWLRVPSEWRLRLTALGLVGFFAVNSSLLPGITGGFEPALVTSNSGFYYEAYYTHADEVAGYQWLDANAPLGSVVNADNFAARKMITYANIYARTNLAPADISRDSYVYLSYGDTTFSQVPFYFDGELLYEQPPTAFLNTTKSLVYSNGAVRIYK